MVMVEIWFKISDLKTAGAVDVPDFPLQAGAFAQPAKVVFGDLSPADKFLLRRVADADGNLAAALLCHRNDDIDLSDIGRHLFKWTNLIEQPQVIDLGQFLLQ